MVKQGGIGVSDVLRIFVDNFQHVPQHRRLHLFASVLQTLSLAYLPDLLLLFFSKHVQQSSSASSPQHGSMSPLSDIEVRLELVVSNQPQGLT